MSEQQTIVQGQRTIRCIPTAAPDKRREGFIDADGHRDKLWTGGTIGEVVDQMNGDLGKVDDEQYRVTE